MRCEAGGGDSERFWLHGSDFKGMELCIALKPLGSEKWRTIYILVVKYTK